MKHCDAIIRKNETGVCLTKHRGVLPFLRRMFFPTILSFVFALATASPGFAQVEEDCDSFPTKQYNDRINCKTKKLTGKMDDVITMISEDEGNMFSEKAKQHLKAETDRANRARERSHNAKGFSGFAKRQKVGQGCFIAEIVGDGIGDDDGVCGTDKKEWKNGCVELDTDGMVGDNDGVCEKKEVCLEICDEANVNDEDDDSIFDEEAAADIEESLDGSTGLVEDLEVAIMERIQVMNTLRGFDEASLLLNQEPDACENLQRAGIPLAAQISVSVVANILEGNLDGCDSLLNNDIAGFNASAVCVVFAALAMYANIATDVLELVDNDILSTKFDLAVKCIEQTDAKLNTLSMDVSNLSQNVDDVLEDIGGEGGINAQLKDVNGKVDTLQQSVDTRLDSVDTQLGGLATQLSGIDTLLQTPQGQREGFSGN